MKMYERNKIKCRGGAGSSTGGTGIKKDIGPKKRERRATGLWEKETEPVWLVQVNQTGSGLVI